MSYLGFNPEKVHKVYSFDSIGFFLCSVSVSQSGARVVKWGPPPWCVLVLDLTHQKVSPLLLWVRTRADLASYLVDRGTDNAQVTCWYHRQFVQVAQARYLSDSSERERWHRSWEEILSVNEIVQYLISPYLITLWSMKLLIIKEFFSWGYNLSWSTTKFSELRFKVSRILTQQQFLQHFYS